MTVPFERSNPFRPEERSGWVGNAMILGMLLIVALLAIRDGRREQACQLAYAAATTADQVWAVTKSGCRPVVVAPRE